MKVKADDGFTKLRAGEKVLLRGLPRGFLNDLPKEDQAAILAVVGKPVSFVDWDDVGRAELEFTDTASVVHYIYVDRRFIQQVRDVSQVRRPRKVMTKGLRRR